MKGTTPQAQQLSREVASGLDSLQNEIDQAIQRQGASGVKKPFDTFVRKMEQAQTWLSNPAGDHTGLGTFNIFNKHHHRHQRQMNLHFPRE